MTLRAFRDGFMAENHARRELVKQYYEIAPALVPLLDDDNVATLIWRRIEQTVSLIGQGAHGEAIVLYRSIVEDLEGRLGPAELNKPKEIATSAVSHR